MEFTFLNRTIGEVRVTIEPWGDVFPLPAESRLVVRPEMNGRDPLVLRAELMADGLVIWCESGAIDLRVEIDGKTVRE